MPPRISQTLYIGFLGAKYRCAVRCQTCVEEVKRCIDLHLQCWQHVAASCVERRLKMFRLRPKAHYLQHLGRDIARNHVNVRLVSACFYDESFLGYIKRIACACHSSSMIKDRFWQRYLINMALRFENDRRNSGSQFRAS